MEAYPAEYSAADGNNGGVRYRRHDDGAGRAFLPRFGSQPPAPEWGLMLNEGRQQLQTAPWLMIFPGLAIFVTVVIFNLWGDALRDVLDPRQEE